MRAKTQVARAPRTTPTTRPIPIWRTTTSARSATPYVPGSCSIQAISPTVSAIAIGSLPPDSASSVRASRRRIWVMRSVAKTAAASVEAIDGAEQERLEPA